MIFKINLSNIPFWELSYIKFNKLFKYSPIATNLRYNEITSQGEIHIDLLLFWRFLKEKNMRIINMKINRNSIIFKLFCILFTLLISIAILVGMWTIKDTNKIMKQEMYRMNNQVLGEIGNNILILLSNVETIRK